MNTASVLKRILNVGILLLLILSIEAQSVKVSHYADKFQGKRMANGKIYKHKNLTAAHNSLAFGTRVMIYTNTDTVIVTITDRGKMYDREFDLSKCAFKKLAPLKRGVIKVNYKIL
jgi:rare lipoprotein A